MKAGEIDSVEESSSQWQSLSNRCEDARDSIRRQSQKESDPAVTQTEKMRATGKALRVNEKSPIIVICLSLIMNM